MDHFVLFMVCVFVMLSRLFIAASWSPAWKGLTSWLSDVMCNCIFATFHTFTNLCNASSQGNKQIK